MIVIGNATLVYKHKEHKPPGDISLFDNKFYAEIKSQKKTLGVWFGYKARYFHVSLTSETNLEDAWAIFPSGSPRGYGVSYSNEDAYKKKYDVEFAVMLLADNMYPHLATIGYDFSALNSIINKDNMTMSAINDRHCNMP